MARSAPAVSPPTDDLDATLERVALADVHPHPRNYQDHPDAEIAHLMQSLSTHGVYRNVVIARDGTLLAGHGVVTAARRLGYTHLTMKRMDLAPDEPRALQILVGDNEIARLALKNEDVLAAVLQDLSRDDPTALLGTGFDADTLAALAEAQGLGNGPGGTRGEVVEPDEPWDRLAEALERWQVHEGDLWTLGRHRLVHGSCLEAETVVRLLRDVAPTMVFADPPYGVSIVTTNGASNDFGKRGAIGGAHRLGSPKDLRIAPALQPARYAPVIGDTSPATAIAAATHFLACYPDVVHVWWGGNYYADSLPSSPCWLVWDKETTGNFADCELAWTNQDKAVRLFRHQWNGLFRASEHERRWHPTQKPAALAAWVYETLGAAGDVILDPFLGSGPSLLAAEQCGGRMVYGCELSTEYIAIALERWYVLTGETPQRLG